MTSFTCSANSCCWEVFTELWAWFRQKTLVFPKPKANGELVLDPVVAFHKKKISTEASPPKVRDWGCDTSLPKSSGEKLYSCHVGKGWKFWNVNFQIFDQIYWGKKIFELTIGKYREKNQKGIGKIKHQYDLENWKKSINVWIDYFFLLSFLAFLLNELKGQTSQSTFLKDFGWKYCLSLITWLFNDVSVLIELTYVFFHLNLEDVGKEVRHFP